VVQNKQEHSIRQIKIGKARYTAENKGEGKAIVAACLAATKIFESPTYLDHTLGKISANIAGHWKEIDSMDFPESTSFFQLILVRFRGDQKSFIAVHLEGALKQGEIQWSVKYLSAPGYGRILDEEDLKKFS